MSHVRATKFIVNLVVGLALMGVSLPGQRCVADEPVTVPSAPRLLPDDAIGYIRIENVEAFRKGFAESSVGRMVQDPKMAPLASDLFQTLAELFRQIGDQMDVTLEELLAIPRGQLAAALVMVDGPEEEDQNVGEDTSVKDDSPDAIRRRLAKQRRRQYQLGGLIFIETGTSDQALKRILDRYQTILKRSGYVLRNETIAGTDLTRLIRTGDQSDQIEIFSRDGMTVIGIGPGTAAAALARWQGTDDQPTLAESTHFTHVMTPCIGAEDTLPQITFFFEPYVLAERLIMRSGNAFLILPIFQSLGLERLQGVGGSVFQGGEAFEDITHVHIAIDPPRDGLLGVIRPLEGDTNPPSWVSDDVTSYTSVNWNIAKTYENFGKIVDRFNGVDRPLDAGGEDERTFRRQMDSRFKRLDLDFQTEFIDQLDDRIVSIVQFTKPHPPNSLSFLTAFQLRDAQAMTITIDKLADVASNVLTVDAFGSTKIYSLRPRDASRELRGPERLFPRYAAIIDQWLVLSDRRESLERAIRTDAGTLPSLATSLEYGLMVSELGGQLRGEKPFYLSFSRSSDFLRQFYDFTGSSSTRAFLDSRGESQEFLGRMGALLKRNELPPFDQFKDYFAPTGSFGYNEPGGIHFGTFTLRPE